MLKKQSQLFIKTFYILTFLLTSCIVFGQTITLYQNNFENPLVTPTETASEPYYDLDSRPVDQLYGGTGSGTSANVRFQQTFTVETILNNGNGSTAAGSEPYVLPGNPGVGLNYSIGMQSGSNLATREGGENDYLAIKLAAQNNPYLNLKIDVSSIALRNRTGGQQFTNPANVVPRFRFRVYDAPNWTNTSAVFQPGTTSGALVAGAVTNPNAPLLDITLSGNALTQGANRFLYNWKTLAFSLQLSAINIATNPTKKVIMTIELINDPGVQYAAIDNIIITSDIVPLPVTFGSVQASITNGTLKTNWETYGEKNNDHFDIEASTDGTNFKKIGTVKSKAIDGNSGSNLNYEFTYTVTGTTFAGITLMVLAFGFSYKRRKTLSLLALALSLIVASYSCSKNNNELVSSKQTKIFIRIAQLDKDGTKAYSKVVQAIQQ